MVVINSHFLYSICKLNFHILDLLFATKVKTYIIKDNHMKYLSYLLFIAIASYPSEAPFDWIMYKDHQKDLLRATRELFPTVSDELKHLKYHLMGEIRSKFCLVPAYVAIDAHDYARLDSLLTEYEDDVHLKNHVLLYAASQQIPDLLAHLLKRRLHYLDWNEALRAFMDTSYPGTTIVQSIASLEVLMKAGASMEKVAQWHARFGLCQDTPLTNVIRKSSFYRDAHKRCREFDEDVQNKVLKLLLDGVPLKLP